MSLILAGCIEYSDERKVCIAEEKGKIFRLINNTGITVRKVKVDKCIPQTIGEKRCDFLMDYKVGISWKVIFIELKGSDLNKALKQLLDTVLYFRDEFKGYEMAARIVGSKDVPNITSLPNYKKLTRQIKPKGKIKIATNNIYVENI